MTRSIEFYYKLVDTLEGAQSWEIWAQFKEHGKVIHDVFAPYGNPSDAIIDWMENRVCNWTKFGLKKE